MTQLDFKGRFHKCGLSADGTPFFPFSVEQKSHNFGLKCFSVPIVGSLAISELNPRSTKLDQNFKYFSKEIFIFSNTMAWKGKIANSARIQALSSHSICDTDLQTYRHIPEPSFSMLRYKPYIFWKLMTVNAMNLIHNISQSFLITTWHALFKTLCDVLNLRGGRNLELQVILRGQMQRTGLNHNLQLFYNL